MHESIFSGFYSHCYAIFDSQIILKQKFEFCLTNMQNLILLLERNPVFRFSINIPRPTIWAQLTQYLAKAKAATKDWLDSWCYEVQTNLGYKCMITDLNIVPDVNFQKFCCRRIDQYCLTAQKSFTLKVVVMWLWSTSISHLERPQCYTNQYLH